MGVFVRQHPEREALFEYAEQLEEGGTEFSPETAEHVSSCTMCAAEVRTMRRSISLTERIKTLEPTSALQASVILAMKSERLEHRRQSLRRTMKSVAFAAGFMLMLGAALQTSTSNAGSRAGVIRLGPEATLAVAPIMIDSLRKQTPEETLLQPALNASYWQAEDPWEKAQQRALEAMDEDIDEALAALQSNPALVRAVAVIHSNRELKRQTLKTLYAQRNL
jgi:protein-tyrosine-phosphatase